MKCEYTLEITALFEGCINCSEILEVNVPI